MAAMNLFVKVSFGQDGKVQEGKGERARLQQDQISTLGGILSHISATFCNGCLRQNIYKM